MISPSFLFRSELGADTGQGSFALTPHEIGSPGSVDGVRSAMRLEQDEFVKHSSLLTLIAGKMGLPLTGARFGYSGPQALDPLSLGIV